MRHLCVPTVSQVPSPAPLTHLPSSINPTPLQLHVPRGVPGSSVLTVKVPCTVPKPAAVPWKFSWELVSPTVMEVCLNENSPTCLPNAMVVFLLRQCFNAREACHITAGIDVLSAGERLAGYFHSQSVSVNSCIRLRLQMP